MDYVVVVFLTVSRYSRNETSFFSNFYVEKMLAIRINLAIAVGNAVIGTDKCLTQQLFGNSKMAQMTANESFRMSDFFFICCIGHTSALIADDFISDINSLCI